MQRELSRTRLVGLQMVGEFPVAPEGDVLAVFEGFGRLGDTNWQGHFWRVIINGKREQVLIPVKGDDPVTGATYLIRVIKNKKGQSNCTVLELKQAAPTTTQQAQPTGANELELLNG